MSSRGVAWTVSPYLVAAVMVRGKMRCVWCGVPMKANKGGRYKWRREGCAGHTVDHYVPAWHLPPSEAHRAENLLPACVGCNDSRRHGREALAARLGGRRQLRNAERRALRQLARPVAKVGARSWSREVRELAERWYGGRLAWLRDWQRRKRRRVKTRIDLSVFVDINGYFPPITFSRAESLGIASAVLARQDTQRVDIAVEDEESGQKETLSWVRA